MGMPYFLSVEKLGETIKIEPAFRLVGLRVEQWDGKAWSVMSGHDPDAVTVEVSDDGVEFFSSTASKGTFNSLSVGGYLFSYLRVTAPSLSSLNIRLVFSVSFVDQINKDAEEFASFIKSIGVKPATSANILAGTAGDERIITDFMVRAKSNGIGYRYDSDLFVEYPARIAKAVRNVLMGGVQKTAISMIGHSIVFGQGAGTTEAEYQTYSLAARISARLNAYLGTPFDPGAKFCASGQQGGTWTLGGSAGYLGPYNIAGNLGNMIYLDSATKTASIQFTGTTAIIYAIASNVGVALSYTIDGGASVTAPAATSDPTGNANWQYYKVTITGLSAGQHTLVISGPASGQVAIVGMEGRSGSTGVVVHRAGVQAMTIADMFSCALDATDATGPASFLSATAVQKKQQAGTLTKLMSADLVMIMCDVNDLIRGWQLYSHTLADCKRHIKNVLAKLAEFNQSVLIVFGPWLVKSYYATGCPFTQDDLARVYREAVAESPNAALIDIRTPIYDRAFIDTTMTDGVCHPTKVGANAIGMSIADAIIKSAAWI